MQNATRLIVIIIRASANILREIPIAVVWAGNNSIIAWYRVKKCTAIGTVAVFVTVDFQRGGLDAFDIGVDGADFGFFGRGLELGHAISIGFSQGFRS